MLATLQAGVKGGKWYSLIYNLYPEATLRAAFKEASANQGAAGVDHVTIERFADDLDANLQRLSEELRQGTYRPQAVRASAQYNLLAVSDAAPTSNSSPRWRRRCSSPQTKVD